jgi:hypothetical protein
MPRQRPTFYIYTHTLIKLQNNGQTSITLEWRLFFTFLPHSTQRPALTRLTAATFLSCARAEKALNRMQSHYQIWGVLKFHAAVTASSCCRMLPGVNYKSKGLE